MTGFESAVEAIVAGAAAGLQALLAREPGLVKARSERPHGATLLHYGAANGVEKERQRTPANIVEIARMLLDAGADVNATARMYGGEATTLSLVATSRHPERAGVQEALLELLLAHGAQIHSGDVAACLWNGRGRAAEYLAGKGASLGLAEAAGIGRLEQVRRLLAEGASEREIEDGLLIACEYGRNEVVAFLLAYGVSPAAATRDGQSALHMAALGAQAETARLLLRSGARADALNAYGATPLGQARWSAGHADLPERFDEVIRVLEEGLPRDRSETTGHQ